MKVYINFRFKIFIFSIFLIFNTLNIFSSKENEIINQIIEYNKKYLINNITKYNYEKKIVNIKKYINLLNNGYFKNCVYNKNILKPKISFITTVFNKENYLNAFIFSIQNQNLKDFELIIVDDSSNDRSVEIITKFKEKDKRINLLRNKKNMHSLYSRYKGAIFSRGKYIYFVDSDDIILKEVLYNSYNHMNKKGLDMIQFNSILQKNDKIWIHRKFYKYKSIIYQPILSYIYYYNNNPIKINYNYNLWDKIIKKKVVIKSLHYIGLQFLHKRIIIENDVVLLFSLFRKSNSFQYIDEIVYYSNRNNSGSVFNSRKDLNKSNELIYSIFSNIEFLYDKTERNKISKYLCIFKLHQGYHRYIKCFNHLNRFTLKKVHFILNKLLGSKFISLNHKILIKNI